MADDAIRDLVSQGLGAARAGSEVAERATAEIQHDAKHPDLQAALEQGNRTAKEWAQRIDRAIQEAGNVPRMENEILEAHYSVSQKIRQDAKDDQSRDLGIVAAGQLALHYWIAAFGTIGAYAGKVGMTQTERDMKTSVEEAKRADEAHTQLARAIMG